MKSVLLVSLLAVSMFDSAGTPAVAEVNYPWCLIMGGRDGSWNCGFVTWQQCMVTRIGTDMCVQNPRYTAAPRRQSAR